MPFLAHQATCPWEKQPGWEPKTRTSGEGWLPCFMSARQGPPPHLPPTRVSDFLWLEPSRGDVTRRVLSSGSPHCGFPSPREQGVLWPHHPISSAHGEELWKTHHVPMLGMPFLISFSAGQWICSSPFYRGQNQGLDLPKVTELLRSKSWVMAWPTPSLGSFLEP